jgi:hypothetical protein
MEKGIIINTQTNEVSETQRSDAEIAERKTRVQTKFSEFQAKLTADATNKANGNQKLLDLGLTQAEATALTGYTPPVAE